MFVKDSVILRLGNQFSEGQLFSERLRFYARTTMGHKNITCIPQQVTTCCGARYQTTKGRPYARQICLTLPSCRPETTTGRDVSW